MSQLVLVGFVLFLVLADSFLMGLLPELNLGVA